MYIHTDMYLHTTPPQTEQELCALPAALRRRRAQGPMTIVISIIMCF